MTWYVKARTADNSVNSVLCDTPAQVAENVADQRRRGHVVWIEDSVGRTVDEILLRPKASYDVNPRSSGVPPFSVRLAILALMLLVGVIVWRYVSLDEYAQYMIFGIEGWSRSNVRVGVQMSSILLGGSALISTIVWVLSLNRKISIYTFCGLSAVILAMMLANVSQNLHESDVKFLYWITIFVYAILSSIIFLSAHIYDWISARNGEPANGGGN